MSDYDTIPAEFSPPAKLPNDGAFTGFSRHVPALISGSASEWDRMIMLMIEVAEQKVGKVSLFSDMMALEELAQNENKVFVTSDVRVIGAEGYAHTSNDTAVLCTSIANMYAVHFSHWALEHGDLSFPTHEEREVRRGSVMNTWRQRFAEQCLK